MLAEALISPEDLELFHVTDDIADAVAHVQRYRQGEDASISP